MTPEQYLEHLHVCIEKYKLGEISQKEHSNAWADYWTYYIGVNVIPANSRNKKPTTTWAQYQDSPISEEQHEQWKSEGRFNDGMAVIMGRVLHRDDLDGYYLVAVDADNQVAIDELLTLNGNRHPTDQFSRKTIVEQHKNDESKLHFYMYTVGGQLRDKTSDIGKPGMDVSTIPTFEVKASSSYLMYPSPGIHKSNCPYEILGTYTPIDNNLVMKC